MKKIFNWIILIIFFVLAFTFAQKNLQLVDVNYYAGLTTQASMFMVVIVTLSLGIIIGYLVSILTRLRTRSELKKAQKQTQATQDQLQKIKDSQTATK